MKPRQILAICAVMAAVIILVLLLPRPTGQHNSSPAKDPQPALASAPKASIQSTVATSKAKIDDIFFLNEGTSGFESLAAKKTTVVKRMPNATGNRRIVDSRSITTPAEGTFIAPRWSPDGLELLFSKAGYEGLYKKGTIGGDLGVVTSKENVGYGAVWNKDGSIDTKTNKGETQKFNPDGSPVESPNVVADDPCLLYTSPSPRDS